MCVRQRSCSPDYPSRECQQRPHGARSHASAVVPREVEKSAESMLSRREEGIGGAARPADILAARLEEVCEILYESEVHRNARSVEGGGRGVVELER